MRVLGDGDWHPFKELFYAIESVIAPETATTKYRSRGGKPDLSADLDVQVREGKEQVTIAALVSLKCEQQGFRHDRHTRSYRLAPKMMNEQALYQQGARVAFRALMAHPQFAQFFRSVQGSDNLNPSQDYWLDFANEVLNEPEVETTDGDDADRLT